MSPRPLLWFPIPPQHLWLSSFTDKELSEPHLSFSGFTELPALCITSPGAWGLSRLPVPISELSLSPETFALGTQVPVAMGKEEMFWPHRPQPTRAGICSAPAWASPAPSDPTLMEATLLLRQPYAKGRHHTPCDASPPETTAQLRAMGCAAGRQEAVLPAARI